MSGGIGLHQGAAAVAAGDVSLLSKSSERVVSIVDAGLSTGVVVWKRLEGSDVSNLMVWEIDREVVLERTDKRLIVALLIGNACRMEEMEHVEEEVESLSVMLGVVRRLDMSLSIGDMPERLEVWRGAGCPMGGVAEAELFALTFACEAAKSVVMRIVVGDAGVDLPVDCSDDS